MPDFLCFYVSNEIKNFVFSFFRKKCQEQESQERLKQEAKELKEERLEGKRERLSSVNLDA